MMAGGECWESFNDAFSQTPPIDSGKNVEFCIESLVI